MLQISKLRYSSRNQVLLRDISEKFEEGFIYGLLGPNGSGKSTLLKNISGIWKPDCGQVLWKKKNLHQMPRQEISQTVSLVPQSPVCHFSFCVEDLVAMGRYSHGKNSGENTVISSMKSMDVWHLKDRPISEISGGERQRVYLARALATESPILLLDEPSSSLDIQHQLQIWELLRSLKTLHRTIIVATHDIAMSKRYCDKILVLKDGACVASGQVEEILSSDLLHDVFGIREVDSSGRTQFDLVR
ncbi:MAG: ABC-type cobalamin/Fe3+-siderophores transport system ATPase subunit [Chlamydiales bacterium]|jgi:ABC-type cobalamin/Fe3+-siderophores transport system ATPase subunit